VFYFGNLAGETVAPGAGDFAVNGSDVTATRLAKRNVAVAVTEPAGDGAGDKMPGVEGAAAGAAAADGAAPVAQGLSGEGVLATGEFWEDLKGFLQQRVRDERVAGEALEVFKGAWEGRSA
jgi:hypothetical protein